MKRFTVVILLVLLLSMSGCDFDSIELEDFYDDDDYAATTCDTGYTLEGTKCVKEEEPITCDSGYRLEDDECVIDVDYINSGMYLVNTEIQPGIYKVISTGFLGGYWERVSGLGGTFSEIIANDSFTGISYMEIKSDDVAVELVGAKMVSIEELEFNYVTGVIEEGVYLVGKDIEPGNYKFTLAEDSFFDFGYLSRLSSVDGEFSSIIMNDTPSGTAYVEILETDFAFEFSGGTLEKVNITDIPVDTEGVYEDGMYLVGIDIEPGIYRAENIGSLFGYWERLSGITGSFSEILANENVSTTGYVEILSSDVAINLSDCRLTSLDEVTLTMLEGTITEGMYLVGDELAPGTYRFTLDPNASFGFGYLARLSDVTGRFSSIITNDSPTGDIYIEILVSDFAFEFSGGTIEKID